MAFKALIETEEIKILNKDRKEEKEEEKKKEKEEKKKKKEL